MSSTLMSGKESNNFLKEDPILGEPDIRRCVKAFGREVLEPLFRTSNLIDKPIREIDVYYVIPDYHYYRRLDFLKLLDRNALEYYMKAPSTQYFNSTRNLLQAFFRAWRFRRLYKSIKKYGIRYNHEDIWSVPWLFASRECIIRLDGSHRASIARYLGYKCIHTLLLTPRTLLNMQDIPDDYRIFFGSLGEPEVDLSDSASIK